MPDRAGQIIDATPAFSSGLDRLPAPARAKAVSPERPDDAAAAWRRAAPLPLSAWPQGWTAWSLAQAETLQAQRRAG